MASLHPARQGLCKLHFRIRFSPCAPCLRGECFFPTPQLATRNSKLDTRHCLGEAPHRPPSPLSTLAGPAVVLRAATARLSAARSCTSARLRSRDRGNRGRRHRDLVVVARRTDTGG